MAIEAKTLMSLAEPKLESHTLIWYTYTSDG